MLSPVVLLSYFPKLTTKRYRDLRSVFSSPEAIWNATTAQLKQAGWNDALCHDFLFWKEHFDPLATEDALTAENIHTITIDDVTYPPLLKEIHDPPVCLFVRGTLPDTSQSLAVVGTRTPTTYGRQVVADIVTPLAEAGIPIVSGLALGIDSVVHTTTLAAHGTTIAVLGGGIDDATIAPRAHVSLANNILGAGGALISENPPKTMPTEFSFPRRNRIIAGMTIGTLVIEAGSGSGALITSQCALDNGRDVFAIPHPIHAPLGIGPNTLIQNGARLVRSAADMLDVFHVESTPVTHVPPVTADTPAEAIILPLLSSEPVHIDHLIKQSNLGSPVVMSTLTGMELKGKVQNLGGMRYIVTRTD